MWLSKILRMIEEKGFRDDTALFTIDFAKGLPGVGEAAGMYGGDEDDVEGDPEGEIDLPLLPGDGLATAQDNQVGF